MLTLFWYKIEQVVKCAIETLNVDLTLPLYASAVLPYNAPGNNTEGNDGDYCWLLLGEVAQYRNPGYLLHRNAPSNLCFSLSLLNDNPMIIQTPFGKYLRFNPLPSKITKSSTYKVN